ncbi:MAG: cupin domain-containing protein [Pseudomonadota bacterium]
MEIYPGGARPSRKARSDWFTGTVWQDPIIEAPAPARVRSLMVHFEPGARTAWHTHPLGQTIHIISGIGQCGVRGEAPQLLRPGDTVWFPPGQEHWHGAAPDTPMSHIAMQEADEEGRVANWLEHVSDADYLGQT